MCLCAVGMYRFFSIIVLYLTGFDAIHLTSEAEFCVRILWHSHPQISSVFFTYLMQTTLLFMQVFQRCRPVPAVCPIHPFTMRS